MASDKPRAGYPRTPPAGRSRLVVAGSALILLIAVIVALTAGGGGGPPPLPLPGIGRPARSGDPFGYLPSREQDFVARATAGSSHVLFAQSPGGAVATAARVAPFRGQIEAATRGTSVDPNLLEAIVFVESAGRPDALAAPDPAAAAGLTQILAQTGQALLGMHIDLARSRALTKQIAGARATGNTGLATKLTRQRARIDDRFDPRKALAATVRYLELARARLGRPDLAVVSYHMGIGNLQQVLGDYNGGDPVPYVQLYFDTSPQHHAAAYRLLSGFGDQSSLYYWRVLGAAEIMRLYRSDRVALERLASLQGASDSTAEVLHPPDQTPAFGDPTALAQAYAHRTILPLPSNAGTLGLAYDASMGSLAPQLGVQPGLYRGLRGPALDLLIELAARVRALSGGAAPLTAAGTVTDRRYQQLLGSSDPPAAAGWSFTLARRYVSPLQALSLQAMLDRLQALNLIAWTRSADTIEVTVAADASRVITEGP